MNKPSDDFWESAEQVKRFAERQPDKRLLKLLDACPAPAHTKVLDLGCAGGRNTVELAQRGFDFVAMDSSRAMVEETRRRVAEHIGQETASRKVWVGDMMDLSAFVAATFDLVIALGIYHNATSRAQWRQTLAETVRVLKPQGQALVSNFSPRSQPEDRPLLPVTGEPNVYRGFGPHLLYLVEAEELDKDMAEHGLEPVTETETVFTQTESGFRYTVNGLYRKLG